MGVWIMGDKEAFRMLLTFCLIVEENIENKLFFLSQRIVNRILNPVSVFFSNTPSIHIYGVKLK